MGEVEGGMGADAGWRYWDPGRGGEAWTKAGLPQRLLTSGWRKVAAPGNGGRPMTPWLPAHRRRASAAWQRWSPRTSR